MCLKISEVLVGPLHKADIQLQNIYLHKYYIHI
nr:MAG TPA: hypothetical protein [Caudoviricetes sp.]